TITLQALTVRQGCAFYENGSNIYIVSGTVVLRNNKILQTKEYCTAQGGGVYVENGTVLLEDNTIRDNVAQIGGGIYVKRGSIRLVRNIITNNSENGGGFGGGFYGPQNEGRIAIVENTISNNTAGWGGGLSIRNSPNVVELIG